MIALSLPARIRPDFKWPRGPIYRGRVHELLAHLKPITLSCIGDIVTRTCLDSGLTPTLAAIDGFTRRDLTTTTNELLDRASRMGMEVYKISNPRGTVSVDAIEAVCRALRLRAPTLLLVDGEEDLLALPALACSPEGGVVVYGAPGMGAVILQVDLLRAREAQLRMLMLRPIEVG
ncbi:MAG: GTP-dependent dephospho-CoA kinase family protein [Desulfurococcales archaeon]|nr:GTP-dependent dephospho-CoA kinase family protein [Desulfurococcales archaeon]MCE4605403.1 GTP-dependent dephospho-CoA kinase family protein [Desulfurococcales archaeon]